jgi:hypothetical protein
LQQCFKEKHPDVGSQVPFYSAHHRHSSAPGTLSALQIFLGRAAPGVSTSPSTFRLYRQLSISITEKHVKKLAKPFNRYDDQSASADLNVVFAWQSGHRPRQRGTTYRLNGAFLSQMQPALLNIYEWASVEWHQFLGHQSRSDVSIRAHQLYSTQSGENCAAITNAGRSRLKENISLVGYDRLQSLSRRLKLAEPSPARLQIPSPSHAKEFRYFSSKPGT